VGRDPPRHGSCGFVDVGACPALLEEVEPVPAGEDAPHDGKATATKAVDMDRSCSYACARHQPLSGPVPAMVMASATAMAVTNQKRTVILVSPSPASSK